MDAEAALLPACSVARRVDRELFLLLGGTAALLLQVAHPLVAAGVAQHSDFTRDPLGRLRRTLDLTLAVVFAEPAAARAALRRIDRRHGPVRGRAADGRPYDARDPALLLWVQTTLVLTSLRLYEAVAGPLRPAERAAYWAETAPIAIALGIPASALPPTLAALERYERAMLATAIRPDATGLALAGRIRRPLGPLPGPLHWPLDALTAALLPPSLRRAFGLRFGPADRILAALVIATLRLARLVLPQRLTVVPQARRFEHRALARPVRRPLR